MPKNRTAKAQNLPLTAIELFGGVGGFRLGLERAGWNVIWSNQWEPGAKLQFASDCYIRNFGEEGHHNEDINVVLDQAEAGKLEIPNHTLLVGGFPCQDYSVAKPLNQAHGIQGVKGVLWWQIYRLLQLKQPQFVLLENVDRLLNSPAKQRGRDFGIILSCFASLGYAVEWRVINAADYGFPQKRRRVFIVGQRLGVHHRFDNPITRLTENGILARAFPTKPYIPDSLFDDSPDTDVPSDPYRATKEVGRHGEPSPFENAGVMVNGDVWTRRLRPVHMDSIEDIPRTLGEIVKKTSKVPEDFFVLDKQLEKWKYLKGAKNEERRHKSGGVYYYTEGALPFPDPLKTAARTVLTSEGGSSPSRSKHIILDPKAKRYRRLIPEELEELNGFPRGWTTGMADTKRAFCMGNALVVGVVQTIAASMCEEIEALANETKPTQVSKRKDAVRKATASAATD